MFLFFYAETYIFTKFMLQIQLFTKCYRYCQYFSMSLIIPLQYNSYGYMVFLPYGGT